MRLFFENKELRGRTSQLSLINIHDGSTVDVLQQGIGVELVATAERIFGGIEGRNFRQKIEHHYVML